MATNQETWQDRTRSNVETWEPVLTADLTREDWQSVWDCWEGRLPPSKLRSRCAPLYGRSFVRLVEEGLYQAGNTSGVRRQDPEDSIRGFCRQVDRVRSGVSGGNVSAAAFSNRISAWVTDGYAETQNSLAGIVAESEVENFRPSPVIQNLDIQTLAPLPPGKSAAKGTLNARYFGDQQVLRMARSLTVDEQDLLNAIPGTLSENMAQIGRAAQRTFLDWSFALIFQNAPLDLDTVPMFDSSHGNLGSDALSAPSLAAGMAAIRSQTLVSDDETPTTIHLNLQPKTLVVPPALEGTARQVLRLMKLDDPTIDLTLRVESRLALPVRNPVTGVTYTGSNTNWLLSADSTVAPWMLRAGLQGQNGPKVNTYSLGPESGTSGQYGLQVDCHWDFGLKLIDFKGAYFSTGQ